MNHLQSQLNASRIFETSADTEGARFLPGHGYWFRCGVCHVTKPCNDGGSISTGYGVAKDGSLHCFRCCGDTDAQEMRKTGKATLYLCDASWKQGYGHVANWPGTLKLPVNHLRKGRHNIARVRYDVWFRFEGTGWHGVQYGDNTQIVHCRRVN